MHLKNKKILLMLKTLNLNFGPQHPEAHGILCLVAHIKVKEENALQTLSYFNNLENVFMLIAVHEYILIYNKNCPVVIKYIHSVLKIYNKLFIKKKYFDISAFYVIWYISFCIYIFLTYKFILPQIAPIAEISTVLPHNFNSFFFKYGDINPKFYTSIKAPIGLFAESKYNLFTMEENMRLFNYKIKMYDQMIKNILNVNEIHFSEGKYNSSFYSNQYNLKTNLIYDKNMALSKNLNFNASNTLQRLSKDSQLACKITELYGTNMPSPKVLQIQKFIDFFNQQSTYIDPKPYKTNEMGDKISRLCYGYSTEITETTTTTTAPATASSSPSYFDYYNKKSIVKTYK